MLSPSSDSSELSNWWPVTLHGDGFGGSLGVGSGAGAGLGVEPSVELVGVLACVCLAGSAGGVPTRWAAGTIG